METMRTFICIDFPSEIIREITRIQSLITNKKFTGKLTEPENLHLTLKFLGEISEDKLNHIKSMLSNIKFKPLNLQLAESGCFTQHGKPRIAWLHLKGAENLQKQIDETLKELFPKEERFMSHLTIARIKYVKSTKDFINYVKNIKPKPLKFQVSSFKLKSSLLNPNGPIYTTLQEYFSSTD